MKNRNCFMDVRAHSGQANMVMMILVLMIVFALILFLLQLLQKPPEPALDNLFVHNMLLSIMRTDTGYNESMCRTVSDAIACYFFEPYYKCDGRIPCENVAKSQIADLLKRYETAKKNRKYYFQATSEGRVVSWMGKALEIKMGDASAQESPNRITANEKIQKLFRGEAYTINVRLTMMETKAEG